jgi:predicted metalloprotease with PDZ domain
MRKRVGFVSLGCAFFLALALAGPVCTYAQQPFPVEYRFSFPDAVHHVMLVEATFHAVPRQTMHLEMSRSSPGRYAAFEFVSNVFEEHFTDGAGNPIAATKTNPRAWAVQSGDGTVHVSYKLFGDKVDGTFVAVDTTHAHLNFPATVLWTKPLEDRPIRLTFEIPPSSPWKIATQLYPTPILLLRRTCST